ncbi:MAG: hypothetical protein IH584_01680, partial [Candidatus Aminicenantes bacterium]|nr:hypothetical protein [Candidatus Aminicenantes bacterium]
MKARWICFLFFLIIVLQVFSSAIEEKVEVKGKIFSSEVRSKSMLIIAAEEIKTLQIRSFADLFS